jgi:hypothetical protein
MLFSGKTPEYIPEFPDFPGNFVVPDPSLPGNLGNTPPNRCGGNVTSAGHQGEFLKVFIASWIKRSP